MRASFPANSPVAIPDTTMPEADLLQACLDELDGVDDFLDRRDLSRLSPALRIEIALGGAIVEREICGVSGPRREGVAQDCNDAGLGQAGKARVGGCRQRGEKEGRQQGGGEKQARHRRLWETVWRSGPPAGRN